MSRSIRRLPDRSRDAAQAFAAGLASAGETVRIERHRLARMLDRQSRAIYNQPHD
jgi:hypothetical protein